MEGLADRDIVQSVRERGLDWLFRTLYDEFCVEAEYIKPGRKPFKIRIVEVERLKRPDTGKKVLKRDSWKYDQSVILMAGDFTEELFNEWPKQGDRLKWDGRLFEVSLGYQFCAWFSGEQFVPAIRIFFKEITKQ